MKKETNKSVRKAEEKLKESKAKTAKQTKTPSKEKEKGVVRAHEMNRLLDGILLPQRVVAQIAEEVAQRVSSSLKRVTPEKKEIKQLINPLFLDTSAIIDARVFELIRIGVFTGTFVVVEGVLDELKHIADSKDLTKKERGRKGLTLLEALRKDKNIKFETYDDSDIKKPVDERIIEAAKRTKGKIITCDFNLSKKAQISNVVAIDMYEMANVLKTTALPGEAFFIKVVQKGKGDRQGVGYLPDGTMVVVEEGENLLEQTVKVLISRVIQTDVGRIFFGKVVV
mgnify:CR=1 FL=1